MLIMFGDMHLENSCVLSKCSGYRKYIWRVVTYEYRFLEFIFICLENTKLSVIIANDSCSEGAQVFFKYMTLGCFYEIMHNVLFI